MRRERSTRSGRARYGVVAVGVMALSLFAGMAVAGLPEGVAHDIRSVQIEAPPPASVAAPDPTVAPSSISSTSARPTSTSVRPTSTSDPGPAPTSPPLDTAGATTAPAARAAGDVRVVVANAASADGLAREVADEVGALGHVDVVATNATTRRDTSVVYFAPSHEREAELLAQALTITAVEPRPSTQFTVADAPADVWVVLGADRRSGG